MLPRIAQPSKWHGAALGSLGNRWVQFDAHLLRSWATGQAEVPNLGWMDLNMTCDILQSLLNITKMN